MLAVATLLFLASGMSAAEPSSSFIRSAFGGSGGELSAELFLSPEGEVLQCKVLVSTLSEPRQEKLCRDTIGKDAGKGATGLDGRPIHSFTTVAKTLHPSGAIPHDPKAELEIVVTQLPDGERRRRTWATVMIDGNGKAEHCVSSQAALADVICPRARVHQFALMYGKSGDPVSYVKNIAVDFVLPAA